ncbi:MAG: ABC transporter ATP-binding protein [Rhodospirillaceae bacterium TMED8]|nr:ABC transporter ATP-binding protein [Magnetovibrio sp.]OUT50071.1 MAG: ABC transporter ATP-binding protein [Rhodospirillaceae bacterium TMED8]|tara:strand:- start:1860 stop:2630 length:771 start_codon:yes stop_codon:yes gene_type:complete
MVSTSILPLQLDNVSFEVRGVRLIKDMSLSFPAGPRTAIIGPNGAGKSLFLRLCHGLLKPTSGVISWATTEDLNPSDAQAMVFQRPVMLRRSVAANIDYALKLRRIERSERIHRIDQVLGRAGLHRLKSQPARTLSFGEQQKLALARAWALKPQILFLDEPTASLDPAATHAVEEIIDAIHAEGAHIILTTHDLGQARRLSDEVIFLHRGRMLERTPSPEFFTQPRNDLAQAFVRGELLWWNLGKDNRKNKLKQSN